MDQSLFAVVMEACLHGTSTRKVDDLVKALGADTGISKSRGQPDLRGPGRLKSRHSATGALAGQPFRYVFLDATYCKARVDHRVVSQAVVVATGVAADGHREVLGFDVGDSEDGAFWTAFLRSLRTRGLTGVQLVISDAHAGLKAAIASVLLGAARGSDAGCTSCVTSWPRSPRARPRWSPRRSAPSSPSPARSTSATSWTPSPRCSAASSPRGHAAGRRRRRHRLRRLPGQPLEENLVDQPAGAAEQGNQAPHRRRRRLPQPRQHCCASPARSWWRPTTNGRSANAATSPKAPWPCSTPRPPNQRR